MDRLSLLTLGFICIVSAPQPALAQEPTHNGAMPGVERKLDLLLQRLDDIDRRLEEIERRNGRSPIALLRPLTRDEIALEPKSAPLAFDFAPPAGVEIVNWDAIDAGMMIDAIQRSFKRADMRTFESQGMIQPSISPKAVN